MRTQENMPVARGGNGGHGSPIGMLQTRIDRIFDDFSRGFGMMDTAWDNAGPLGLWNDGGALMPSLDMHETDKEMVLNIELPGVDEKDIEVAAKDQTITVSGEKRSEFESRQGDGYRSERVYGHFARSVSLPFAVDASKVKARCDRGVLTLTIPKPAEAMQQIRKIPITH